MGIRTLSIDPTNRTSIQLAGRLTCLCPVNGKRDYATVEVSYHPTASVVELESFAAYLASFANEQIGHEAVTEAIRDEIAEETLPDDLTVRTRWEPVEGVECVVVASQ
jgi:NADPH-dependent 7-cyano-7-deazaguanine reductase QueF